MGTAAIGFLLAFAVTQVMGGSFLVTSPQSIIRGTNYDVTVDILNTTQDVDVEAQLQNRYYNHTTRKWKVDILNTQRGMFSLGYSGVLAFPIQDSFACSSCRLHVRGRGGLQFERSQTISVYRKLVSILIQTDKAIYKPDQTVRYRAVAVYPDLQLYSGNFTIEIRDPRGNIIKIDNGLRNNSGVVEGSLELGAQLPYGEWNIKVSLGEVESTAMQSFTVEDYDLPRFEITVDLPPYMLVSNQELTGTVNAKYTFGQPVKGRVELRVGPNRGADPCGALPPAVEITFEIDGKARFRVPVSDIRRVTGVNQGSKLLVMAFVKEAATGVRLNGTKTVSFHEHQYSIDFLGNSPDVFKPGLPYTAFVQVKSPDGMPPPPEEGDSVSVYAYATYRVSHPEINLYGTDEFTGTYPLPGYNVSLPANGILPIGLQVPDNATSVTLQVHYKHRSALKTVSKPHSKSNNYMQLFLDNKNLKPGDTAMLRLQSTEPLNAVSYVILSRGSIVSTATIDGAGEVEIRFEVPVTAELAPTAHILAYYIRNTDEIIADSIAFNIDGIFTNEVSVAFDREGSEPGQAVDVTVTADPDSQVNLLAVDQSVLLLKTGNDITAKKVENAIANYDPSAKPEDSEFPLSYSSRDMRGVFRETGLNIITDVYINAPRRHRPTYHNLSSRNGLPWHGIQMVGPTTTTTVPPPEGDFSDDLAEVGRIRKVFPEAWLWRESLVGSDGKAVISTKVPDTITSWIASAFATNPRTGLGVSPTTAKLTVFQPFFVSLTYPSTIKQKEIAIIQATVFNYLPETADVTVTLTNSPHFSLVTKTADDSCADERKQRFVRVPADEQVTVYFAIVASDIGVADIEVKAQSRFAADGVKRDIVIEAEGAPVSFNYPIFVNLDGVGDDFSYRTEFTFPMPPEAVKGSETARVKVSGDLIGPSLKNLDSLLSLPTGCGEQSMVAFAPILYAAQYMNATDKMTEFWEGKIKDLLSNGYQRQLTYQRYDHSFSAFGNRDESGSTWLTAFVARVFMDASKFIYIDCKMVARAVDWIIDRQNRDGSFSELGRVLDPNTQGEKSGPALTSYVLLTLIKAKAAMPTTGCPEAGPHCIKVEALSNSIGNATAYLELETPSVTKPFDLALMSYALKEANSMRADEAFNKLLDMAKQDGPLRYWNDKAVVDRTMPGKIPMDTMARSVFTRWRPPRVQKRPIDILITSYALLSFASHDRLDDGLGALTWLTSQRNARGGFASTQDTVVAMHALATIATKTITKESKVKIRVNGDRKRLRFRVNQKNALQLQIQEFRRAPRKIDVQMNGKGVVVTDIDYNFNVNKELRTASFDVSPVLLDDDIDSFNLMICTKWLWDRKTGMVVQEIGIPSGFSPDLTTLGKVIGMKRSERQGDKVAIYFDEIGKTSTCYSILMTRVGKVAKSRSSYVRTYDYYEPGDQSTVFYHPKKLKQSTIEDVCPDCCRR